MAFRFARSLALVMMAVAGSACVGDDPVTTGGTPGSDAGAGEEGGTNGDAGADAGDGSHPNRSCTSADDRCADGNTLERCPASGGALEKQTCALGCSTAPAPHCKDIVPSAPVTAADLDPTGLAAITIPIDATLDSDTGAISGGFTRAANADPNVREVKDGIAMRLVPIVSTTKKLAIFSMSSFKINEDASLLLTGSNPVAFVSDGDVTLHGILNASGTCMNGIGGPGGGTGGTASIPATGNGAGNAGATNSSYSTQGGSGGGHGGRGGNTSGSGLPPKLGGSPNGNEALVPFLGGSGGGGGGDNPNCTGGRGGGGGGAIMIVSRTQVIVGGVSKLAGITAGGCGGSGGVVVTGNSACGGGGGGSGGAVLIEAPVVEIRQSGAIVANGGGGGAGGTQGAPGNKGGAGGFELLGADGGSRTSTNCTNGAIGGSVNDATLNPAASVNGSAPTSTALGCDGGAGGGTGRLRFNTLTGKLTLQGNGFTSPRIDVDINMTKLASAAPITTQ